MAGMDQHLPVVTHDLCPPGSAFLTDGRAAVRIDMPDGWAIYANDPAPVRYVLRTPHSVLEPRASSIT